MVRGGAGTRSVRPPSIVGVLPVRNGVQSVPIGDPILDPGEEFFLAVENTDQARSPDTPDDHLRTSSPR